MRIAMIGAGYVGLVSGACFSDFGHEVICVDASRDRIDGLNRGEMPIYEPGLADLVAKNVHESRLSFTMDLPSAVSKADAVFIAVGTPSRRGDGHADLSYVYAATRQIAESIHPDAIVSPNQQCRLERAMKSNEFCARFVLIIPSLWFLIPNSCGKAQRLAISNGLIVS